MKFIALLLSLNLIAVFSTGQESVSSANPPSHKTDTKQVVEYKLAGLRPGQDKMDRAYNRFGEELALKGVLGPNSVNWDDPCNKQLLTVTFDKTETIVEVKIEALPSMADCIAKAYRRSVRARMGGTGHGLVFGDGCDRIQQIYGESQSPPRAIENGKEFEYRYVTRKGGSLLFEISCGSAYHQVEAIKLTAANPLKP